MVFRCVLGLALLSRVPSASLSPGVVGELWGGWSHCGDVLSLRAGTLALCLRAGGGCTRGQSSPGAAYLARAPFCGNHRGCLW